MVTSCATLTSHELLFCVDLSKGELSELCLLEFVSSFRVWKGLSHSTFSLGNTVRSACFVDSIPRAYGPSLLSTNDNFLESKLIYAPALSNKSVSSSPSTLVGRGHTKNVSGYFPAKTKETRFFLMSRDCLVTP